MTAELSAIYALLEQALAAITTDGAARPAFSPQLKLTGVGGALDSLDTMLFLDEAEERLRAEFGTAVSLVNDEVFAKENSPFATVESLAAYIRDQLEENA